MFGYKVDVSNSKSGVEQVNLSLLTLSAAVRSLIHRRGKKSDSHVNR